MLEGRRIHCVVGYDAMIDGGVEVLKIHQRGIVTFSKMVLLSLALTCNSDKKKLVFTKANALLS